MPPRYEHPDREFGDNIPPGDPNPKTMQSESAQRIPTSPPGRSGPGVDNGFNPGSDLDIARLREAMEWSEKEISSFRLKHAEAIRHFAGNRYGDTDLKQKKAINILQIAVNVWRRQLVSQTPRSLVITRAEELKPGARELEIAMNYLLDKMNFGESLAEVVQSAIFTMGIMKVGVAEEYIHKSAGVPSLGGQPYAEPVLFEDWIHDMNARRPSEWTYCGNRYRVLYDEVMQNPDFDSQAKNSIAKGLNQELPANSHQKESSIGGTNPDYQSEFLDHVELWDIYVPSKNVLVTMAAQPGSPPLRIVDWDGPEGGPYKLLTFGDMPGRIIPASPAQSMFDLQDLFTILLNKLGRQAIRQKTVTTATGMATDDGTAMRVGDAEDGEIIRTNHPDAVREIRYGGVDPANFQFTSWLREMLSYAGGNIDAMGGLAQQAGTLGQEQLLVQSSSEFLRDMQSKVLTFTSNVLQDVGWYVYTNPVDTYDLVKSVPNYGEFQFKYGPDKRKASFYDYNIDVQPYSMQMKTPQERLAMLLQLMQTQLLPLAPQMAEFGMTLDLKKFVELVSKYGDLPEVNDIVSSLVPLEGSGLVQPQDGNSSERPLQSAATSRNYTRTNVSGVETQSSRDAKLGTALARSASQNRN